MVPSELLTIPDIVFSLCPRKGSPNDLPNDEPVADLMSRETKTSGSQSHPAHGDLCAQSRDPS
jgi:hypothetical protein